MYNNILFVCTGNICRSAMSEYLLKKMLKEEGITELQVWSRGIAGSHTLRIPAIELELMDEENIDISQHVSHPLLGRDVLTADLILVMEKYHKERLQTFFPEVSEKIFLLSEFVGQGAQDIKDPIGLPDEVYKECRDMLKYLIKKLVEIIKK